MRRRSAVRRGWRRERRGSLLLLGLLSGGWGAALERRRGEGATFVRELFGARAGVRAFEETALITELEKVS